MTIANVEMAKAWDGDEGSDWARDWEWYDNAGRVHHEALMAAAAIRSGERVLDIGCGNGETTREAARACAPGTTVGIDLSSQMLGRARELATAQGIGNVEFVQADAQVHHFDAASYDVVISRFGAMFFGDPVAAFTNIAGATTSGGRLVMVVWRGLDANEWLRCVLTALAAGRDLPSPPPGAPGPLSWADPQVAHRTLGAAGFSDVTLEAVDGPLRAGADATQAFGFFSTTGVTRGMLADVDPAVRSRALDALADVLAAHDGPDGVVFGSGTWLVSARRP
jgi:SAM-dependent methyltransferase